MKRGKEREKQKSGGKVNKEYREVAGKHEMVRHVSPSTGNILTLFIFSWLDYYSWTSVSRKKFKVNQKENSRKENVSISSKKN